MFQHPDIVRTIARDRHREMFDTAVRNRLVRAARASHAKRNP